MINVNVKNVTVLLIKYYLKPNIFFFLITGSSVVRSLLPRMVLLWRNSFPRSNKELESEKARGDAFTWQVIISNACIKFL